MFYIQEMRKNVWSALIWKNLHSIKTVNVLLTEIFDRFVGNVCLEISRCYYESILMKVSDIPMHIIEITWLRLKIICQAVVEIHRKAIKIKI